jgi:hypothetical protein
MRITRKSQSSFWIGSRPISVSRTGRLPAGAEIIVGLIEAAFQSGRAPSPGGTPALPLDRYSPSIARNSSSESTATPSERAFSSFEPAASPATRYDVFADTDAEALPPSRSMSLWISSRE